MARHVLQGAPRDIGRTDKIDADGLGPRLLPLCVVDGLDGMSVEDTGVVDEDVDAAEVGSSVIDHRSDRLGVAQISLRQHMSFARQGCEHGFRRHV